MVVYLVGSGRWQGRECSQVLRRFFGLVNHGWRSVYAEASAANVCAPWWSVISRLGPLRGPFESGMPGQMFAAQGRIANPRPKYSTSTRYSIPILAHSSTGQTGRF